jgi:hypothetical protein
VVVPPRDRRRWLAPLDWPAAAGEFIRLIRVRLSAAFGRRDGGGWLARPRRLAVVGAAIAAIGTAVALLIVTSTHQQQPRDALWIVAEDRELSATPLLSPSTATPSPTPSESIAAPASPAANLRVIDYSRAPTGFPPDPQPDSTVALTEGAHPTRKIPAYDAPGGQARAYLAPTINGVSISMPIVERRGGWIAVLLPSANRTIAWLGPEGWSSVSLRDQIVIRLSNHQLSWYRSGQLQQAWTVATGAPSTPTPLGRSFVLGRSPLPGKVYAGIDVLALGSVPDNPNAVVAGLRGAHIGIHSWYTDDAFGKSVSNGCLRVPQPGQRLLLSEIVPGTEVVVVN